MWGPWLNGGAWLQANGRRVDWLYRDLLRVATTIEDWEAIESLPIMHRLRRHASPILVEVRGPASETEADAYALGRTFAALARE